MGYLEDSLRGALDEGRAWLAYQPVVSLLDQNVVGHEALFRVRTRDGDEISPAHAIPIAEQSGLIIPLGRWILEEAVSTAADSERSTTTIAVNVSPMQLLDAAFARTIDRLLSKWSIDPSRVHIELTESWSLDDPWVVTAVETIRSVGCQVGLDDFGTRYSCLSLLQTLSIDFLKLDCMFTRRLGTDRRTDRLVEAILRLADDLGLDVIAEGVETESQRRHLTELGCGSAQGYLFGRPSATRCFCSNPLVSSDSSSGCRCSEKRDARLSTCHSPRQPATILSRARCVVNGCSHPDAEEVETTRAANT